MPAFAPVTCTSNTEVFRVQFLASRLVMNGWYCGSGWQCRYAFKIGGVDGCDCEETLKLIAEGKIYTEPLITHTYPLCQIEEAYELFENKRDGVIKAAVEC